GIRDFHVTGVQTCALPIWVVWYWFIFQDNSVSMFTSPLIPLRRGNPFDHLIESPFILITAFPLFQNPVLSPNQLPPLGVRGLRRSEERRVGKEGRSRGWAE